MPRQTCEESYQDLQQGQCIVTISLFYVLVSTLGVLEDGWRRGLGTVRQLSLQQLQQ